MKNHAAFIDQMLLLGGAVGRAFDDVAQQAYWDMLDDVEDADFAAAVRAFSRGKDDWPTVGKLRAESLECRSRRRENERFEHYRLTGQLLATDGTPIPSLIDQQATSLKRLALAAKLRERRAADEQQRSIEAEQDAADAVELARLAEGVATAEATESDPLARLRVVSEHAKLRAAIAHRSERSGRSVPSECEVSQ